MTKKIVLIISLFVLCITFIVITFALYYVKPQLDARASASAILSFSPSSSYAEHFEINPGERVTLDIMLDPGKNHVSILKVRILFKPYVFKTPGKDSLILNKDSFPSIIDGPVINASSISFTLSVGADPDDAIKFPTKIGTIHLDTKEYARTSSTLISFSTDSQAYSVNPEDHAFENVLIAALPAYVAVGQLPPQITPSMALASPADGSLSQAPTPDPEDTILSLTAFLQGIGNTINNTNADSELYNRDPHQTSRTFDVEVYDRLNTLVAANNGTLHYDRNAGNYTGAINLGNSFLTGNYSVKIHTPGYVSQYIEGIHQIEAAATTVLPQTAMIAGDISGDGTLNIVDFHSFINCFTTLTARPQHCTEQENLLSDLNDDNDVNLRDYELLIKAIKTVNSKQL